MPYVPTNKSVQGEDEDVEILRKVLNSNQSLPHGDVTDTLPNLHDESDVFNDGCNELYSLGRSLRTFLRDDG